MVGTVCNEQDGLPPKVFQQCGKDGQPRSAWQAQAVLTSIVLELSQQLLILRKGTYVVKNDLHFLLFTAGRVALSVLHEGHIGTNK
jgi:hypothetical protein